MPRGKAAETGTRRVSQNGYDYTKTEDRGWVLTHWLTMEEKLGRQIGEDEMVQFISPKFKKDPTNINGLRLIKKRTTSLRRRKAQIEERIRELKAELAGINEQLGET